MVGILVLQLGIMIHSLVIGLTLSITHGVEFSTFILSLRYHCRVDHARSFACNSDHIPSTV